MGVEEGNGKEKRKFIQLAHVAASIIQNISFIMLFCYHTEALGLNDLMILFVGMKHWILLYLTL